MSSVRSLRQWLLLLLGFTQEATSGSILWTFNKLKIHHAITKRWQYATRWTILQELAVVVDQCECGVCRILTRTPHQLERNSRTKLKMGHILRRISVASHHTGWPRAAWTQLGKAANSNALTQGISISNASHFSLVVAVCYMVQHGGQVTVIEVVKAVSCVALPWFYVGKVFQPPCPEQTSANLLPVGWELFCSERPHPSSHVLHSFHGCAWIRRIHYWRSAIGTWGKQRNKQKGNHWILKLCSRVSLGASSTETGQIWRGRVHSLERLQARRTHLKRTIRTKLKLVKLVKASQLPFQFLIKESSCECILSRIYIYIYLKTIQPIVGSAKNEANKF